MLAWLDAAIQVLAFSGAAVLALVVRQAWQRHAALQQRLGPSPSAARPVAVLRARAGMDNLGRWAALPGRLSGKDQKLELDLMRAGFEHPLAPTLFVAIRYALALGLPTALIISSALSGHAQKGAAVLAPLWVAALCLVLPRVVLRRMARSRQQELEREFPDALDLMVVCVDAGLSLEAAILRVSRDMRTSHPRIAREFGRISQELNAGLSRADALRHMAERIDTPLTRGFVTLLVQSQALGASIGQGLRTYSDEMRAARVLNAEEKALRIPVLMSLPMVACFLPVIVTALLLPSTIDLIRILVPSLAGHPR